MYMKGLRCSTVFISSPSDVRLVASTGTSPQRNGPKRPSETRCSAHKDQHGERFGASDLLQRTTPSSMLGGRSGCIAVVVRGTAVVRDARFATAARPFRTLFILPNPYSLDGADLLFGWWTLDGTQLPLRQFSGTRLTLPTSATVAWASNVDSKPYLSGLNRSIQQRSWPRFG
jgi:hypothetical protein